MEILLESLLGSLDIDSLYEQFHIIARYYNWDRHTIKSLSSNERGLWVDKIIAHENRMNGGDEADDNPEG